MRHERLAGLHDLPDLDRLAADDAGRGRLDRGALEVQLRLRQRRLGLLHRASAAAARGRGDLQLLGRGLRRREAGLRPGGGRLRPARRAARPRPRRPTRDATSDCAASAAARAACGGRDRGVELLLRDLFLGDQRLEALDVALGLDGRGLRSRSRASAATQLRLAASTCRSATAMPACASSTPLVGRAHVARSSTPRRSARCCRPPAALACASASSASAVRHRHLVVARVDLDEHACRPRRTGCRRPPAFDDRAADARRRSA